MAQPPGYHAPNSVRKVCRLQKTLYGLKQSGRHWYQKLVEIMTHYLVFSRCDVDQVVFFRQNGQGSMIVLVHVDDCTIAASSTQLISHFKAKISEHVEITDLSELHWLLGIKVRRNREQHTIHFSQRLYITSILRRFNLDELKPLSTPMQPGLLLSMAQTSKTTAEWALMRDTPYYEAIGSLMYAALGTRPGIAFAIQTLSQYSTKFGHVHWNTVKRVFSYLKGTKELWLTYGEEMTNRF